MSDIAQSISGAGLIIRVEVQAMPPPYSWESEYIAAITETDWPKTTLTKIGTAESTIHKKQLSMVMDHGGTIDERAAIAKALGSLVNLRTEVVDWQARKKNAEKP